MGSVGWRPACPVLGSSTQLWEELRPSSRPLWGPHQALPRPHSCNSQMEHSVTPREVGTGSVFPPGRPVEDRTMGCQPPLSCPDQCCPHATLGLEPLGVQVPQASPPREGPGPGRGDGQGLPQAGGFMLGTFSPGSALSPPHLDTRQIHGRGASQAALEDPGS